MATFATILQVNDLAPPPNQDRKNTLQSNNLRVPDQSAFAKGSYNNRHYHSMQVTTPCTKSRGPTHEALLHGKNGPCRNRTYNLAIKSRLLCQLS
jgi:hypothetical protein